MPMEMLLRSDGCDSGPCLQVKIDMDRKKVLLGNKPPFLMKHIDHARNVIIT
jgi:hypothetical protein